jgi:hypothetical protein
MKGKNDTLIAKMLSGYCPDYCRSKTRLFLETSLSLFNNSSTLPSCPDDFKSIMFQSQDSIMSVLDHIFLFYCNLRQTELYSSTQKYNCKWQAILNKNYFI